MMFVDFDIQNNRDMSLKHPRTFGLEVVFQRDKNVEVFGDDLNKAGKGVQQLTPPDQLAKKNEKLAPEWDNKCQVVDADKIDSKKGTENPKIRYFPENFVRLVVSRTDKTLTDSEVLKLIAEEQA